jgi:hypothetical protein
MAKLEGNGFSQMLQIIREHGYNKDVDITIGTVKKAPPELLIELDRSGLELDKQDCFVAFGVSDKLTAGDKVIVMSDNNVFFIIDKAVKF